MARTDKITMPTTVPTSPTIHISFSSGTVKALHDFLPFGDEIPGSTMSRTNVWGVADGVTQKFTGQERDDGPGLDYFDARYFASPLGRFTSPDPLSAGADPYDPQTWNAYAYVSNSPLSAVDPDGLQSSTCSNSSICAGNSGSTSSGYPGEAPPWFTGGGLNGDVSGLPGSPGFQTRPGLAPRPNATWFQPGSTERFSAGILGFLDSFTGDAFSNNMSRQELLSPFAAWAKQQNSYKYSFAAGFVGSFFVGEGEMEVTAAGISQIEEHLARPAIRALEDPTSQGLRP